MRDGFFDWAGQKSGALHQFGQHQRRERRLRWLRLLEVRLTRKRGLRRRSECSNSVQGRPSGTGPQSPGRLAASSLPVRLRRPRGESAHDKVDNLRWRRGCLPKPGV